MPEGITSESLVNEIMETISEGVSKTKDLPFFDADNSKAVKSQCIRLFGRDKPVHHLLGGGKSADVMLWRNKTISASFLTGATVVWVIFEWLGCHFLTLLAFALVVGMLLQFVWTNASGILNRSPSAVPRVVLPEEYFVSIGRLAGSEVNRGLSFLQDVASGGNMKQFLVVVAGLWAAAIIGGWFNLLTLVYIGIVAAHTFPVLYERYDEQIDGFANNVFDQLRYNYKKLDTGVLSRIPKAASFKMKKWD